MTKLLLKLFVKNYSDTADVTVHAAVGKLAATVGIVGNLLLAVGKLIMGIVIGSVSVAADGINNLTDTASSVMTLLGFCLARRPADKAHPYGHARYEYLSALGVAALVLLIGAELVKTSVNKILFPVSPELSPVTVSILVLSVLVKLWMSVFFSKLGKHISSSALAASSIDCRNDVIATCAVLLGYLLNILLQLNLDGYVGIAVALFILYSGIRIAKETISPLLGKQADTALTERISAVILSHEKVLGIHDLLVHDYGPGQCHASVHVEMSAEEDPLVCHDVIDDIECDVLDQANVHLVIHYDPVVKNDTEQDLAYQSVCRIVHSIDPRYSLHDFRMVRGSAQTKLVFDLSVPYDCIKHHRQIKVRIDKELAQCGTAYPTVIRFDGKE